ncbi:hypothetical protein QKW60_06130 [Defluviimonas aestuarii]|uniref:hypothetical protein n=1 Tax=Albidovulum aestuarii TaxID=1130726 RepID=UPI002499F755|nr:hypothetical protein [Defluviimonas aestuarii]MDI3335976.1 hypothetical protein [Defluviimonas aestuarii]
MTNLIPAALLLALTSGAGLAETCIRNGDATRLFFSAETDTARRTGWLEPGAALCAAGAGHERVSVFEDEDALEGCTRLVPGGGTELLLRYASFDNCLWQSHLD